jgi:diguanylate cyclase
MFPEGTVLMVETVLCHDVYLGREPVHIADLRNHPRCMPTMRWCSRRGCANYSGLPVTVGDDTSWVLAFLRQHRASPPDAVDIAYMGLIADWLGNALHQSAQKGPAAAHRADRSAHRSAQPARGRRKRCKTERARTQRDSHGFALALVDIDHFKMVNDRYGHAVGDEVLNAVARRFESGLRDGDWVARWGGEEFLFVLHGSTVEAAASIMERLADQDALNAHPDQCRQHFTEFFGRCGRLWRE